MCTEDGRNDQQDNAHAHQKGGSADEATTLPTNDGSHQPTEEDHLSVHRLGRMRLQNRDRQQADRECSSPAAVRGCIQREGQGRGQQHPSGDSASPTPAAGLGNSRGCG